MEGQEITFKNLDFIVQRILMHDNSERFTLLESLRKKII